MIFPSNLRQDLERADVQARDGFCKLSPMLEALTGSLQIDIGLKDGSFELVRSDETTIY